MSWLDISDIEKAFEGMSLEQIEDEGRRALYYENNTGPFGEQGLALEASVNKALLRIFQPDQAIILSILNKNSGIPRRFDDIVEASGVGRYRTEAALSELRNVYVTYPEGFPYPRTTNNIELVEVRKDGKFVLNRILLQKLLTWIYKHVTGRIVV